MSLIEHALPPSAAETRDALYGGRIFVAAATPATRTVVAAARTLLADELGHSDVRREAMRVAPDRLFAAVGRVRRAMFTQAAWHAQVRAVLEQAGFAAAEHAFDPLRLRVVLHRGHERAEAAAVYVAHRDTWYAHPQALVTGWLALDDLTAEETFVFFPERFARPVPNTSERFNFDAWTADGGARRIGWQDRRAGRDAHYPAMTGEPPCGPPLGFDIRAGELLLFSGAHLHRTLPQATGRARFSLDFRFVHLGEAAAGRGAPNVDNRSTGSALPAYFGAGQASERASTSTRAALAANPPATTS